MESLTFRREERPEGFVLFLSGEVNHATAPALWSSLNAIFEDGLNVIVDLGGVTQIDSVGMKILLDIQKLFLERGQSLILAQPAAAVREVMEAAGPGPAIAVHPSLEAALQSRLPAAAPDRPA